MNAYIEITFFLYGSSDQLDEKRKLFRSKQKCCPTQVVKIVRPPERWFLRPTDLRIHTKKYYSPNDSILVSTGTFCVFLHEGNGVFLEIGWRHAPITVVFVFIVKCLVWLVVLFAFVTLDTWCGTT